MPTNKSEKKSILDESFSVSSLMQGSDSYKSLIYGIVTVIVLFVVIALGLRTISQNKAQIDNEAVTTQNTAVKAPADNRYTVAEGDTLWSIAEKSYNDGFSWHVIAEANNITDPSALSSGTKLIIPTVTPTKAPVVMAAPTAVVVQPAMLQQQTQPTTMTVEKITGATYTVVHGDNLWDIATRAYGDGYRWTDIANVNHLANPDLIYSGNVLNLPRP